MRGDADGLKSAIENVVRNALIYGDPAQPVEVEATSSADAALVRVLDRGPGVPDSELSRIFEPFYRTDKSRDHQKGGQGIGLAITTRVTELHGGSVDGAQSQRRRARDRPQAAARARPRASRLEAVAAFLVQHEIEAIALLLGRHT